MDNLRDCAAIVTGSSSGVGAATAKLLASMGCNVLVNYNSNRDGGEAVAEECRAAGVDALGACAVGIHGCKSAPVHALGRSISLHIQQYSPQSSGRGRGDSEFSLSRIPMAQAPSLWGFGGR